MLNEPTMLLNETTLLNIYKHFSREEHKFIYGTLKLKKNSCKFKKSYGFNARCLPGSYIYWASRNNQLSRIFLKDNYRYKYKNTHEIVEIYQRRSLASSNKLDKIIVKKYYISENDYKPRKWRIEKKENDRLPYWRCDYHVVNFHQTNIPLEFFGKSGCRWGPSDKQEMAISLSNFEEDISKIKSRSVVNMIRNTIEILYLKKYGLKLFKENGIINIISDYIYYDHKIYKKKEDIIYEIEKLY